MRALTTLMVTGALALGLAMPAAAQKVLKVQTSQNTGDATFQYMSTVWAPKLEKMSGGSLKIELLPTKAVVPHRETMNATQAGILDGALDAISYFAGVDPAYGIIGDLIAGFNHPDEPQTFCMNGGGKEVLQKLHDKYFAGKIHVVGCGNYTKEALVSTKPIRTVADLKGVKIRSPEGLAAEVFKRAGATPVSLPFSEVYTSLEKGIVDAADASSYINNHDTGLNKIGTYPLYPGIHSMAMLQFVVNKDVWNALNDSQKAILEVWYIAAYADLRRHADIEDRIQVAKDRAGQGTVKEVINWTDEEREKFREIAVQAWEDYSKKSELSKEVYDVSMKFMKNYGLLK